MLLLASLAACAVAPSTRLRSQRALRASRLVALLPAAPPHSSAPSADASALRRPNAVAFAAMVEVGGNTAFLYPPRRDGDQWGLGVLELEPVAVRRTQDGWLVLFPFACPPDRSIGRAVHVDDHGEAQLLYPPVRLPSGEPLPLPAPVAQPHIEVAPGAPRPDAVGFWSVDIHARPSRRRPEPGAAPTESAYQSWFVYDGQTVVLYLLSMHPSEFHSEDELYRVPSRWRGDVLEVELAAGVWRDLARWRHGRFETAQGEWWLPMRRATRAALRGGPLEYLRPRPLHDPQIPLDSGAMERVCGRSRCVINLGFSLTYLCRWWSEHPGY